MYDVYNQKSNYPFKGEIYTEYRYFQTDTTIDSVQYLKGAENPFFKVNSEDFMFNITSSKSIEKKQPISNLIFNVAQIYIDTKYQHEKFVIGGYIGYDNKLWVIKKVDKEMGPQKILYSFFTYNPLSTYKMLLEEVSE